MMGSPFAEVDRRTEEVLHKKRIGRSFAIAATPVTKEQLLRFLPDFQHDDMKFYPEPTCPIGGVTWYEAAAYCNWLSKKEGIPEPEWCYETNTKGQVIKLKEDYLSLTGYRLPTEAEWEYACRAEATTRRSYGDLESLLTHYAWCTKNSDGRTWPVGSKKPNDLGLFDMHGNVWNWCQGKYGSYPEGEKGKSWDDRESGLGIASLENRVLRGGSLDFLVSYLRSASRICNVPANRSGNYGFRPARTLSVTVTRQPTIESRTTVR